MIGVGYNFRNKINRRVKGSKEKMKVSFPVVIREYNTYMGGVDPCDQMKVSFEVDQRIKVRFYLQEFFDFLDIRMLTRKLCITKSNQPLQSHLWIFDSL